MPAVDIVAALVGVHSCLAAGPRSLHTANATGTTIPAGGMLTATAHVADCFTANAVAFNYGVAIAVGIFCFIASAITRNDSWVDRLWSVLPVYCAWSHVFFVPAATAGAFVNAVRGASSLLNLVPRVLSAACSLWRLPPACCSPQVLSALLISIWGARLTYNFWRKGGYKKGGEDYRWVYVRQWPIVRHPLVWYPFSLVVVSLYQITLLVAIALPVAQVSGAAAPTAADAFFLALHAFFILLETAADQQQWDFHQHKHALAATGKGAAAAKRSVPAELVGDCERGFLTHGLFAHSRHPNVFAEQSIWVCVFLLSLRHAGGVTVSGLGALSLVLLTLGSSRLTERISSGKYPAFAQYQQSTPFLYPAAVAAHAFHDIAAADSRKHK